jgi:hypothetical protein
MIINIGSFLKRNYKGLITLVPVLFVIIVAYPGRFYFLNDDFIHIPLAGKGSFVNSALYRPLSDVSLWIDYKLWNKNPFGYHLTNLLIHLTNSFLVYKLARLVFTKYSTNRLYEFKSFLAGLLFLVYAYHSEPLFWIIGRGGSLVTTFFLLAFYFYYKSEQSTRYLIFSVLFFVIGLFVYETIWIFPAIVTIEYIVNKNRYKQFDRILIIWAAFLLFFIFRFIYTDNLPDEYELGLLYKLEIFQLLYKYNTLLARCFLPPMANSILFIIMYIILLCGILFSVYQINSKRLFFHIICLMIAILPTTSLGIDTHDSESERFIYLATVFAVFSIVEVISYLKKPLFILTFLLISFFHSFKLFETSNCYEFSSLIAKESLQFIRLLSPINFHYTIFPNSIKEL